MYVHNSNMFKFRLTLANPQRAQDEVFFEWQVLDTPPALMWMKLFLNLSKTAKKIYPRFTGFISPHKTMAHLRDELNLCIDTINGAGEKKIFERATDHFDQSFSNVIHHHFEVLGGSFENPSVFYKASNKQVRKAIAGLNQNIHDMEALSRALEVRKYNMLPSAAIICEVIGIPRYEMPEGFYKYFTMDVHFGDLFLHYSQIGKTWMEVFADKDTEIFPEAIRPLSVISGEFDAAFYNYSPSELTKGQLVDFLIQNGQDPKNPKLALGFLPVAKFNNTQALAESEIHELIGKYFSLKKAELFNHDSLLGSVDVDINAYDFIDVPGV